MWASVARAGAVVTLCGLPAGCNVVNSMMGPKKAIADAPYAGDRPDAPPLEQRGNATFAAAAFDETGRVLVTMPFLGPPGLIAWDATNGAMLSRLDVGVQNESPSRWMIDGARGRILGQDRGTPGFRLLDLRSGKELARVPEVESPHPAIAVGLVGDGNEVLLFKPGSIEVWQLDPPRLARSIANPLPEDRYYPICIGGMPFTYNDKTCWEWSPDRRALAMAVTTKFSPASATRFLILDAMTLESEELAMPSPREDRSLAAFAWSPDGRWLGVGTDNELLLYDRTRRAWGASIPGDHKRNQYLGAMRFTPDSQRVIALGDQLQVSVYDVATGARLGRHEPAFENFEGVFDTSLDGRRIVIYKFLSDTFEVLDGQDAHRLGWVCPYFCNALHNPIQPAYAVSPDGKSVAISHRRGTAIWDTATDQIRFPLRDPERKPLH